MAGFFGKGAGKFYGMDPATGASDSGPSGYGVGTGLDYSTPPDPYAGQRQDAHPGFFGKMGQNLKGIDWGSTLLGGLADGVAKWGGAEPGYYNTVKENNKDSNELHKALLVAAAKAKLQEPTMMQRNREYLISIGRQDLADSYTNAEANPQTLMTNPATGAVGFYPKGGMPGADPTSIPAITDQQGYDALPRGAQFRDPQGNVRTKS